ncbi:MAG: hypothetical protein L3K26_04140 [Candidatus Hydrogenedentes bacterium]|nr:hypothetical protein [Candidatus Hydrogenedentota bacterium]
MVEHVDITDGASRARIDSWKALEGTPMEKARVLFVELVAEIVGVQDETNAADGGGQDMPSAFSREDGS